ncbi:MAG: hypothetical protein IJV70_03165 [Clostridia bacterium]|nr:hypothetical protein [Clostridia bacterium]
MFDEFESEDDQWRPAPPKWRTVGFKIFKIGFTVFAFFIIGLMCFRLMSSKPPKNMKELIWDESLVALVAENTENGKATEIKNIISYDSFSEDGMFSVYTILYVPELEQLQFTVRYNNRALNYLEQDYPGSKDRDGEHYRFLLRDDHETKYTEYSYTQDEKMGYTYRRLIFSGVSFTDVSAMYVDVYYAGDFDASEEARHTMYVYRYDFAQNKYTDFTPQTEPTKDLKK